MRLHRPLWQARLARLLLVTLALLWWLAGMAPMARAAGDPAQGPGGPILVVTSGSANFGTYYAEILRTEGLNAFAVADISTLTPGTLAAYDVVVLAKMPLTAAQVTVLTNWVGGGGNLIAMAPDAQLAGLLGITAVGSSISNGYLLVDTSTSPGNGIVNQTIQFHGAADLYTLNGATRLATLYSNASTPTANPAVTLRSFGSGRAAAFTYDLAASIVQTRQGNPAWAAQERDGFAPIRSNDKFYGNKTGDVQPDWVDPNKIAIPQADEQQRLLANLIIQMNMTRKPLPRFWYFPNGKKAVVVMTGHDHGNGGTAGRFEQFKAVKPSSCSLANWECVRGTSYLYTGTPLSDAQAAQYVADGFELGLPISTGCADYDAVSLESLYTQQLQDWQAKYTSVPAPATQRHHCAVWSDWTTGADVQANHGMRLDTSYSFYPPSWVNNTPGLFTGSAVPMRFARLDGAFTDVYMAATQMSDDSGQVYPFTIDTLLDRALGSEGYFGAYTVNAQTDDAASPVADAVLSSALARDVPVVSARQMLTWLDARNASSFGSFNWNGSALGFTVARDPSANGLQAMLPTRVGAQALSSITRAGSPVSFTVSAIKGVEYALFAADGGSYVATYANDTTPPAAPSVTPAGGATGVSLAVRPTAAFGEAMDASTINAGTFELRDSTGKLVHATISYDASARTATLVPTSPLSAAATYTATLRGGASDPRVKDAAGNALSAGISWSFTTTSFATALGSGCPCGGWSDSNVPVNPSTDDSNAVELGVKFRSDVAGFITGIRFYKGTGNTGTHIGNLWTAGGALLARATFGAETASGWQQVNFASPVAITADTVYVASYFAPNGHYASDWFFFSSSGVDNPPVHLLKDGESGGNGVYGYTPTSAFPSSSFRATNYWVDVVFDTVPTTDTTPPAVIATSPASGSTGASQTTVITATFNEAIDPATVTSSTFELRTPASTLVSGAVSYSEVTRTATFAPNSLLTASTTYTVTLKGGSTGPSITDLAGNALAANASWSFTTELASGPCGSPANAIVAENCLAGVPKSEWDIDGVGDYSIQGFATNISVNRGSTVSFKVQTDAPAYRFDIYRMGYYGGMGARKVASVLPTAELPQSQPSCLNDVATGLIDCGNWSVSGSWSVPADAVSGIYFAKLVRTDTGGASHIIFVVRNDGSTSDLLFQTSDTTWHAYNRYGGNSLYSGSPAGRAYKVSYNRPFDTRATGGGVVANFVFSAEYPMVRWLEANGYDVSYFSGVDADRLGNLIQNHKTFLSVGHDEYWSAAQRANVEAARAAGVNLAFFSGNEIFWKTRWETSIDGSGTPYRTLVCYKETHANARIDPLDAAPTNIWTGTWRDPRFSPPADGGRPENALTGSMFMMNYIPDIYGITVPEADGKMRLWRNTSIATLLPGQSVTLAAGTLGFEFNSDLDNGARPAGLIRMSTTAITTTGSALLDYGSTYGAGTVTHHLTLYKHSSGARVFGAGTIQWAWGLDSNHDVGFEPADVRLQQATVNLLADMNAQPATLQAGLSAASASTDTTPPTSAITFPSGGAVIDPALGTVTISGTASDTGGGVVGGVEVSTDGGATWHPANGRGSWTYNWTPAVFGTAVIKTRAADDSGNLETPTAGVTVTVGTSVCPCTIWPSSSVPAVASYTDTDAVNVGVKFKSDLNGFITGIRFYKGAGNTGTHVGTLWTSGGAQLATATFTGESASGWQQVNFATPVAVTANTVYVASYFAPNGGWARDAGYFATKGFDRPPLHALQDGVSGGNGLYAYGAGTVFPSSSFQSTNYWVDVVFTTGSTDTTPPTVTATTPASGATGVSVTASVTASFSEAMDPATIGTSTFELRNPAGSLVPAAVTYNATSRVATLSPNSSLAAATTYTVTIKGGATDPRVKDLAGNALATARTWSFTTAAADTTPPTVTATSPASGATGVSVTSAVTASFSEAMDPATIVGSNFELRTSGGALVPAAVSYNALTNVATLTPSAALAGLATYTATVTVGVKDLAGNALATAKIWSFTTAAVDCPCTIWPSSSVPAVASYTDTDAVNVGVKFKSDLNGFITGIRFYKGAGNTGTHVGTLWTSGGAQLATAAFTGETASGWQQVNFATPVAVTANTVYVASYFAPNGGWARDAGYFATNGVDRPPLHALQDGVSGGNGVYAYGTGTVFPSSSYQSTNYWVDVVFTTGSTDTTPPTVTATTPASGATGVSVTASVTASFSEAMDPATIGTSTFELRNPAGSLVPAAVTYNATSRVATLSPNSSLAAATTYTVTIKGGATDPRVKDLAGNALATARTWSFTTAAADTTPPTVTATSPASGATGVSRTANVTATFSEAMDPATISTSTFELRNPAGTLVPAAVTYNATSRVATLNPNASLAAATTYTVTIKGGATDPRVKDVAGNALAVNRTWSFRTR